MEEQFTFKNSFMKNIITFFIITFFVMGTVMGQTNKKKYNNYNVSKKEITTMMLQQAKDWSNGNIEGFMEGYIKSDGLKFVGSKGITYG